MGKVQFQNQSRLRLTISLVEFTAHPAAGELTNFQQGNQTQKYVVANITHIGSTSGNLLGFTCMGRWLNDGTRINRIEIFPDGGTFTAPRAWFFGVKRQ